jgi:adenosylhomocysteine nucleosidase
MTVGMISAIPEEYSKIKWDNEPVTKTVMKKKFQIGKINDIDIIAVESGIGKVNAAVVTTILISHFECNSIVFSGVAGGLNPNYNIGDVIIADKLIQHDYGAIVNGEVYSSLPGSFPALEDSKDPIAFEMSREMREYMQSHMGNDVKFGTILTGDTYLSCSQSRDMFHKQFSADAIEMEGAALAQVCCQCNIPFIVVRVLSDLAGENSHTDFDTFVDNSSKKSATVVTHLLPILDAWHD